MRKLLFILLALLAAFVAGGFLLPSQVHVERSLTVARPPATVFTLLNGFGSFRQWSPWMQTDPNAEYHYSGPESGVGARMSWNGDPALVGEGWQEVVESEPYERVAMDLDFGIQGVAKSVFSINAEPPGSRVTWTFDIDVTEEQSWLGGLLGRYFGLFLDDWVGADFEEGLEAFRGFAESLPEADFAGADIRRLDVEPLRVLSLSGTAEAEPNAAADALAAAFRRITAAMTARGLSLAGQPMAITRGLDAGRYVFEAAIPVEGTAWPASEAGDDRDSGQEKANGDVVDGLSPGGPAVRIVHTGPYDDIDGAYDQLAAYIAAHGLERGELSWEHYISDPANTPPDRIVTHVYIQLAGDGLADEPR